MLREGGAGALVRMSTPLAPFGLMSDAPRSETLELGRRTLIMGVLNVTPDSFSDGGRYLSKGAALVRARQMREEGADLIDIGGESTRPGADPVSLEEESARVVPVVRALREGNIGGISIDTTKSEVARRALEAGAEVVNDISGLAFDEGMADVVAGAGARLIVGHTRGSPKTMQSGAIVYPQGVVSAVLAGLDRSAAKAEAAGIPRSRIMVDPGFGFGKSVEHNCQLLRELKALSELGLPIVVGTSRKTFLGTLTGRPVHERVYATAATVALAIGHGAAMVRVHDVAAMRDVVRVADAIVGKSQLA